MPKEPTALPRPEFNNDAPGTAVSGASGGGMVAGDFASLSEAVAAAVAAGFTGLAASLSGMSPSNFVSTGGTVAGAPAPDPAIARNVEPSGGIASGGEGNAKPEHGGEHGGVSRGWWGTLKETAFEEYGIGYGALELGKGVSNRINQLSQGQYASPEERQSSLAEATLPGAGALIGTLVGARFGSPLVGSMAGEAGGDILTSALTAKDKRDEAVRESAEKIAASLGLAEEAVSRFKDAIVNTGAPVAQVAQGLGILQGMAPGIGTGAIAGAGNIALAEGPNFLPNLQTMSGFLGANPALYAANQRFAQHGGDIGSGEYREVAKLALSDGDMASYNAAQQGVAATLYGHDETFKALKKSTDEEKASWVSLAPVEHVMTQVGDRILTGSWKKWFDAQDPINIHEKMLEDRKKVIDEQNGISEDGTSAEDTAFALNRGKAREDLLSSGVAANTRIGEFKYAAGGGASAAQETALLPGLKAALDAGAAADQVMIDQNTEEITRIRKEHPGDKNYAPFIAAYEDENAKLQDDKIEKPNVLFQQFRRAAFDDTQTEQNAHYSLAITRASIDGKSAEFIQQLMNRQADYLEGVANEPRRSVISRPALAPTVTPAATAAGTDAAAPSKDESLAAPDAHLTKLLAHRKDADEANITYLRAHVHSETDPAKLKELNHDRRKWGLAVTEYVAELNSPAMRADREMAAAQARGAAAGGESTAGAVSGLVSDDIQNPAERMKRREDALQLRYQAQQNVFAERSGHDDNVIGGADLAVSKARLNGTPDDIFKAQGTELEAFKGKIEELTREMSKGGQTVADLQREHAALNQVMAQSVALTGQQRDERVSNAASLASSGLSLATAGLSRQIAIGGSDSVDRGPEDAAWKDTFASDVLAVSSYLPGDPRRKAAEATQAQHNAAYSDRQDSLNVYIADAKTRTTDIIGDAAVRHEEHAFSRSLLLPYQDGGRNADPLTRGNELLAGLDKGIAGEQANFAKETASRAAKQGKIGADGKPLWSDLSEETYQAHAAASQDRVDAFQDRKASLEHDKIQSMFNAVPESIIGNRGLPGGMGAAISPTDALSASYEPSQTVGSFGLGGAHGGAGRGSAQSGVSQADLLEGGILGNALLGRTLSQAGHPATHSESALRYLPVAGDNDHDARGRTHTHMGPTVYRPDSGGHEYDGRGNPHTSGGPTPDRAHSYMGLTDSFPSRLHTAAIDESSGQRYNMSSGKGSPAVPGEYIPDDQKYGAHKEVPQKPSRGASAKEHLLALSAEENRISEPTSTHDVPKRPMPTMAPAPNMPMTAHTASVKDPVVAAIDKLSATLISLLFIRNGGPSSPSGASAGRMIDHATVRR